jgi:hypothetical protein
MQKNEGTIFFRNIGFQQPDCTVSSLKSVVCMFTIIWTLYFSGGYTTAWSVVPLQTLHWQRDNCGLGTAVTNWLICSFMYFVPSMWSVESFDYRIQLFVLLLQSALATSRKVAGPISKEVIIFFQFTKSFQLHYGPGFDSASNSNEYEEYSWGVKRGRCVRLTTSPPSV